VRSVLVWVVGWMCVCAAFTAPGAPANSWSMVPTVDPARVTSSQLNQVSCVPSGMCVAVGQYVSSTGAGSLAERWNGANWSLVRTLNPRHTTSSQLNAVSCVSASACVAVGSSTNRTGQTKTLIERLRRGAWTIESSPNIPRATYATVCSVSPAPVRSCSASRSDSACEEAVRPSGCCTEGGQVSGMFSMHRDRPHWRVCSARLRVLAWQQEDRL
jgi:hypothetical protein